MNIIKTIPPKYNGYQFVIYGDSCSGIPGKLHESNLTEMNNVLKHLDLKPEFIIFPGDEIIGLTNDEKLLRKQWKYWLDTEMAWVMENNIPMYNSTGNHTTYNKMSESVFRDIFFTHPSNGPKEQKRLSYFIEKGDLLLVFINSMWSGLGGEGRIETEWLEKVLSDHSDRKLKLVIGHHPIFPVNGFLGEYQREIEAENGKKFWDILKKHGVFGYICSHILAFDVQMHDGIMQLLTAGAGTDERMPEGIEYLHVVQASLDSNGICYQVLDKNGDIREWLKWPIELPNSDQWIDLSVNNNMINNIQCENWSNRTYQCCIVLNISGKMSNGTSGSPQTFLCGTDSSLNMPIIWAGLTGMDNIFTVYLSPDVGFSPHHWYGPSLLKDEKFNLQFMIHTGMGPGGLLWRYKNDDPWSSLSNSSSWGPERCKWPKHWSVGENYGDINEKMEFNGTDLKVKLYVKELFIGDILKKA